MRSNRPHLCDEPQTDTQRASSVRTSCCSNNGERPHRRCRLLNEVENIDERPRESALARRHLDRFSRLCIELTSGGSTLGPEWGGSTGPSTSWLAPPPIVARPPNLAVLFTRCGQLILRKISKFDAVRCQISRLKCTKIDFRWVSAPDPARGAYSAHADPLTVFKGAYF